MIAKILVLSLLVLTIKSIGVNDGKPIVKVYYESLCPDSRDFILNSFKTYDNLQVKLANVELVPHGNSNETFFNGTSSFTCQHGPEECYGNRIHNCAKEFFNENIRVFNEFVFCHFENAWTLFNRTSTQTAEYCFEKLNFSKGASNYIRDCAVNERDIFGYDLQSKASKETPEHSFIPWITVNNKRTEKNARRVTENLTKHLCGFEYNLEEEVCKQYNKVQKSKQKEFNLLGQIETLFLN